MSLAGNICSVLLLLCVAVQDFRTRTISAWLLPAIVLALLLAMMDASGWTVALLRNAGMNAALLFIQLGCLWLFVSVRNKRWTNIINTQIGTGDVLLLLCLAPFFSPMNFFVLYTFSIVFALVVTLLLHAAGARKTDQVPFAGFMAVPLIVLCMLRIVFPSIISFCNDNWLQAVLPS